ncbi:MAG: recombinase family protein, partial [Lacticaseibacillus rhamnosus]
MFKPNEMAKRLGVTVKTLQKWDNSGKFKAHRTPTNRRYYTEDQYLAYIGHNDQSKKRLQVAYARVSNVGQKDDLANQIDFLRRYANGKG